jgi:hypothetical protein
MVRRWQATAAGILKWQSGAVWNKQIKLEAGVVKLQADTAQRDSIK